MSKALVVAAQVGVVLALMLTWSMATARYGGPDEPAHVLRAAAAADGDLVGARVAALAPGYRGVAVPAALATGDPSCFRHDKRVAATEDSCRAPSLPVHAQMLRSAAQNIQKNGAEFSYTLRSLAPINANNGPQTQVEQTGLEFVASHPGENYCVEEQLGGRSYFTAVYADRATLTSCVECHNQHPQSTRHDLKNGDVMGGIVVRVPLEF